jgi:UDP-glucose 4-epimerase
MNMSIFVTGGAGYIGSHTLIQLLEKGHDITVIDNLSNSSRVALDRACQLSGSSVSFIEADICNADVLDSIFAENRFDAVIHFAGLKAVGESVAKPLSYYEKNVNGTLCLLQAMSRHAVKTLIFSSSATVYGNPETLPLVEASPRSATNPYGRSKLMVEEILEDLQLSDPDWRIACLRYFNPVGAHPSGLIGEDPLGVPNNLMPFISQVAAGTRQSLSVFGADYSTPDGTGVRDYIHVMDLAKGHLAALVYLSRAERGEFLAINLGTGRGYSVLEMISAFERASGRPVPYKVIDRRPGDVASCYADPSLAKELLGWKAELDIDAMCADTWNWQSRNPDGYRAG